MTSIKLYILLILIIGAFGELIAQTSQWRLIWDKNAIEDSVEYYVVYRRANALPTSADSVGWRPQPASVAEDTVVYADFSLAIGTRYYYRVIAVDSLSRRSGFSAAVDAAVPEITFGTLVLTVDTTQALDTVVIDLDDEDYLNDPDDGFNVSWNATSGSQISVQIDAQNRATFITTTDLAHQESLQFSVVDPDSLHDARSVLISLTAASTNQVPEINTSPQQTVQVDEPYQYTVTASDPDGDNLTFIMTEGPAFLDLTQLNNTSARISGTPSQTGSFRITIVVNDGHGGVDDQTYFLNVTSDPGSTNLVLALSSETFGSSIVRLTWSTTEPTKDHITYGLDQGYGLFTLEDSDFKTEHEVIIKGLLPDTTYHYQIVSETQSGSEVMGPQEEFQTEEGIKVEVFPIPYVASRAQANDGITFVNVPESSTIIIYNLMAEPVFKVDNITHVFNWDIKNKAGRNVSAGLYIYHIRNKNDKRLASGKLIIVR